MNIIVYNIRVKSLIEVLKRVDNQGGYVDIALIKGEMNDSIRVTPSNFQPQSPPSPSPSEQQEIKFDLNNINDYI